MQRLTLLLASPLLFLLAAAVILPVSQEDARLPSELCFRTGPCLPSEDGAGLDSMLAEHLLVHREDLSLECRITLHSGCSQHLACLLKPCFPSPRCVHLALIKSKKASRDTGVAAASHAAQVWVFLNLIKELYII